jgi:hypothetical protein
MLMDQIARNRRSLIGAEALNPMEPLQPPDRVSALSGQLEAMDDDDDSERQ